MEEVKYHSKIDSKLYAMASEHPLQQFRCKVNGYARFGRTPKSLRNILVDECKFIIDEEINLAPIGEHVTFYGEANVDSLHRMSSERWIEYIRLDLGPKKCCSIMD